MKRIYQYALFLIPLCPASSLFAQHLITGQIMDTRKEPVPYAVITICNATDSAIQQTTIPDSLGLYSLTLPDIGNRLIKVSATGYVTEIRTLETVSKQVQIISFVLRDNKEELNEVLISANKPLFERKTDRVIFNVASSTAAIGSNALDLLKKAPGVLVQQQDNSIHLAGKGTVQVFINDRIQLLSGEDLIAYLQAMPADNIERIEIITAPPAQYDAAGNSGIIQIVLKKNNKSGLNGSIRAGYEQASYAKAIGGGGINFQKGKWNLYGNVNYSNGANQVTERLNTWYARQVYQVTDNYKKTLKPLQYSLGADYEIHKQATLGFQLVHNVPYRINEGRTKIDLRQLPDLRLDSIIQTNSYGRVKNASNTFNVNYVVKGSTTGKKLSLNANHFWFKSQRNNDYETKNYLDNGFTPTGTESRNKTKGDQDIAITTAQADLELPAPIASFTFGTKFSFINSSSNNIFQYYKQDKLLTDPSISNAFDYAEQVQAVYANVNKAIGKWNFQAGLRGEFTQTEGYSRNLHQTNTNQYFNLFPTAYVQYSPNNDHQWNFNYSKRINRPGFRSLDPFRAYTSPYYYSEGNPFLSPSFNHNVELSYALKGRYTFSAFYQYERNHFGSVWMVDTATHIGSSISNNFADFLAYGINAMGSFQPLASWEVQVQMSAQIQQLNSETYTSRKQSYQLPFYYASWNNTVILNKAKTLFAEVNVFYLSKYREDFLEINPMGSLDIGIKALLLNKKLTCSINANDILATQKAKGVHVVTGQTINNYFDTRNVRLMINYKLGNYKTKTERETGIEDEKKRAG